MDPATLSASAGMDVPEQSPCDRQSALGQRPARRERLTERVDRSQSAVQAPAVFAADQTQREEDRHRSAQAVSAEDRQAHAEPDTIDGQRPSTDRRARDRAILIEPAAPATLLLGSNRQDDVQKASLPRGRGAAQIQRSLPPPSFLQDP